MRPPYSILCHSACALSLLVFIADATAEDRTARFFSLNECIQLALQHNYDIQIERYSSEIARYNLNGSYGAYEPFFNFSAGERFLSQPSGFDPKKPGVDFPYELTTD